MILVAWSQKKTKRPDPKGRRIRGPVTSSSPRHFADGYGDVHPEENARGSRVGAPQGQYLLGSPRNGDANEITVAYDVVGRVEVDPAGAGQISLHPGVCGAATCEARIVGHEDIPRSEEHTSELQSLRHL